MTDDKKSMGFSFVPLKNEQKETEKETQFRFEKPDNEFSNNRGINKKPNFTDKNGVDHISRNIYISKELNDRIYAFKYHGFRVFSTLVKELLEDWVDKMEREHPELKKK